MFPLKLLHSLVSGNTLENPFLRTPHEIEEDDGDTRSRNRIPLMLFIPTQELVRDTYRLASIAREIGMNLHPNPSLSHIIFSWPSPPPPPERRASSSSSTASWSSYSSWSLPNDSVPIPFPSLATASLSNLRLFANLSKGYFKLAFLKNACLLRTEENECLSNNNLNCTSLSLYSNRTGERVDTMDGFTRALLGMGWTLYKTDGRNRRDALDSLQTDVYLYRKMDMGRTCAGAKTAKAGNGDSVECSRVRELRLPPLDFRNPPLRILQYIVLMTDDAFYLD